MKIFISIYALLAMIIYSFNNSCQANALPAGYDEITVQPEIKIAEVLDNGAQTDSSTKVSLPVLSNNDTITTPATDLQASDIENKIQTIPSTPIDPMETTDNVAAASNLDPTVYSGGILSPEAVQQYISQFGAAYPYAAAPYPAPIYPGFVPAPPPPIYPSPYVVETGYDGYLVPATATTTTTTSGDMKRPSTTALSSPLMILSNIISTIMMSSLFRIFATIASAVGMIFFSGTIMNLFCTYTPICEMSNKAVTYLKRQNATENMGRMVAEEITPERVRRAAEFVRNAISKYQKFQELMGEITSDKSE